MSTQGDISPVLRRRIVLIVDGKQRTYTADDDGLMYSYHIPEGRRWIGWRALAHKFERALEDIANA